MPTRTVTGTIVHADGMPWQNAEVAFLLMSDFVAGVGVYPIDEVEAITDALGQFSINLSVPVAPGTAYYQVRIPDHIEAFDVYLAAGAAVDLSVLLTLATTSVAASAVQVLLDAYATLTVASPVAAYPVGINDDVVLANGTFTVTLPAATGSNRILCVKNISVGTITLAAAGVDLIDGVGSQPISALCALVILDGAVGLWNILGG